MDGPLVLDGFGKLHILYNDGLKLFITLVCVNTNNYLLQCNLEAPHRHGLFMWHVLFCVKIVKTILPHNIKEVEILIKLVIGQAYCLRDLFSVFYRILEALI